MIFDLIIAAGFVGLLAYLVLYLLHARRGNNEFNAKIDAEVTHLRGLLANMNIGTAEYENVTRWIHNLLTSRR